MRHTHDPATGTLTLTAPHAETAVGLTIEREAGYAWHAGKWPMRVYRPSPALRRASYWHDSAYEDMAWDWPSLAAADAGFVEVYTREGGNPILAAMLWSILRAWSIWTVLARTKPPEWRSR